MNAPLKHANEPAVDFLRRHIGPSPRDIDAMLARLTAHSADHFGIAPDEVNWGGVGALGHIRAQLREVSDNLFSEGEYA